MILCITPNPAVDRTAWVPRVVLDEILRPDRVLALPGGKGFNVARAVRLLGGDVVTAGVAGGHAGRWLVARLEDEGLRPHFVASEVEARTAYVVAGADRHAVMVYEPGEPQPEQAFGDLLTLLRDELLPRADYMVIAGSVPQGIDPGWVARVVTAARKANVPCLVDARGASLRAALDAAPTVLKANEQEFADAGLGSLPPSEVVRTVVRDGVPACIMTLGQRGAVACANGECWVVEPPVQDAVNAVGAGDAFTAGVVVALAHGERFEVAIANGAAVAAASVLELGAGVLDPAKARELSAMVRLRKLA
jgi:1-phosphofructokinase family hexose kinase